MQPWKRIAFSEDQLQVMYREWGIFYTRKEKSDLAADFYTKSLELKDDPKALYYRSRCKRSIAQTESALIDARAAMAHDPYSQPFTLEVCDALYELNAFETSKCEQFNNSLKFKGSKLKGFNDRSDVLDQNFNATIGDTLGPFIWEHEKYFYKSFEEYKRKQMVDNRPLWKVLQKEEKCDVLSVLEEEEELLFPLEIARRQRAFNIFNQIYMRRSWIDILFLRDLQNDPSLLLPQSQWTRPILQQITQSKYIAAMKFLHMLHARTPLYTQKVRKCPNRELARKSKENYLFRVQYQTHRTMLAILKKIKYFRSAKKINKLTTFVEEVMGDYVVLKSERVMPWRFEFINEVYNLVALAYVDHYVVVPKNLTDCRLEERFGLLLKLSKELDKEQVVFVFGDRSTYTDQHAAEMSMARQKKFMTRTDRRILFSKHSIEKAFIWHEMAKMHLKHSRYDECCLVARKVIEEARKCNSFVWMLLGLLLKCKSHAVLRKIEKIGDLLVEIDRIAKVLQSDKVTRYVELLSNVHEQISLEKRAQEDLRRVKSRVSELESNAGRLSSYASEILFH